MKKPHMALPDRPHNIQPSTHVVCPPWLQQSLSAGGSPDALVSRLYAGPGRQQRLAENSPPRNTSFGTTTVHNQYRQDVGDVGDSVASPVGGVSGLIRSRAAAATAATNFPRDSLAGQQQADVLVPRLIHHQPSEVSPPGNGGGSQRGDGINSPPRIGARHRTSGGSAAKRMRGAGSNAGSRRSSGGNVAAAGYQPQKQGPSAAHQQQPSVGGGMMLSRSLGALGQAGAGRSTLAIVNTRDDGAPYLRSEKMSPKSSLRAAGGLSSIRSSPGREPLR